MDVKGERVRVAAEAYKKRKFPSVRAAAVRFGVAETTLRGRLKGVLDRSQARLELTKLKQPEEASLVKWALSMNSRGLPPRPASVRKMADFLLALRDSGEELSVGQKWATRFVSRHPTIKTCRSRRYDYKRALCESPAVFNSWFDVVNDVKIKYGICEDDTYNVDETGFMMGLTGSEIVITGTDIRGRKKVVQAGNKEFVTAIECINASGWVLDPFIVFKGKQLGKSWFNALEDNWRLGVSPNGWTSNDIAVAWLKKVFIPQTRGRAKGEYQLLILDGHGSHLTVEFDQNCTANKKFRFICHVTLFTAP